MTDLVCVGALAGAYGVKGESRLKSFCAVPEDIARYSPLTDERGAAAYAITLTGTISNGFAARIAGVTSKEQADALRGVRLYARRAQLPSLPDDEFYHADLIGLEVFDTGGARLGTVRAIFNHGAGDILEIYAPGRRTALLLPFTRAIVPTVDLTAGRIVVDPPKESEV